MQFVIDSTPIIEFGNLPFPLMFWRLFVNVGWIPIGIAFLWGAKEMWMRRIQDKWREKNGIYTLLAVDIPKGNEQSPKAIENMFTYLAGARKSSNLIDKYWDGEVQWRFSLEIISIEGYTQFIIYTPVNYRNSVESAIYSQYPGAEVTEIEDYTKGFPTKFPDEEYDIWGSEFIQTNDKMYPIKTHLDFYHPDAGPYEPKFKDPMATLMDLNSSMGKGEHLWHQIIIVPKDYDWMDQGDREISKILKEKVGSEKKIVDKITNSILKFFDGIANILAEIFGIYFFASDSESEEELESLKMVQLKPKDRKRVEGIQRKISNTAFDVKIRMVYMAKKNVFNKPKAKNGFAGYIKQFADLDLNNLKQDGDKTTTVTSYFLKDRRLNVRKNNIINAYIKRSDIIGMNPGLMNIEELATLWHFPIESSVKAPQIQKTPATKVQPPMGLPETEEEETYPSDSAAEILSSDKEESSTESSLSSRKNQNKHTSQSYSEKKGAPPDDLPIE